MTDPTSSDGSKVVAKPDRPHTQGSFTRFSEAEVREKAEAWMPKWRN